MRVATQVVRWGALITLAVVAIPAVPGLALLLVAETTRGRLVGALVALGLVALVALLDGGRSRVRRRIVTIAGSGVALGVLVLAASSARSAASTHVDRDAHHVEVARLASDARIELLSVGPRASAWSVPVDVVPERDLLRVGLTFAALADPQLDRTEVRSLLAHVHAASDAVDALFGAERPSALGLGAARLFGARGDPEHRFVVRPTASATVARTGVVVLHGAGGNLACLLGALAPLAARDQVVLAHPSFGLGRWDEPGGLDAIEGARRWLVEREGVAPDRVFLVGLSNGALGVSRAAIDAPDRWAGIGFVSPVFDDRVVAGEPFAEAWRGRPVWIWTGEADDRVPASYVRGTARGLARRGVDAELEVVEGLDHFAWLESPDRLRAALRAWIRTAQRSR